MDGYDSARRTDGRSGGRDRNGRRDDRGGPGDGAAVARLLEQLPPHAIEAEMSVLGSMLIEPQVTGDVLLLIGDPEDFFRPAHQAIYRSMVELYDRRNALDIVQLTETLRDRGDLDAVGGVDYLVELAQAVPTAANAVHYARIVRDKAATRRLIGAAGEILHDAHEAPDDVQTLLEDAERKIFEIASSSEQSHADSLKELVMRVYELIEASDGRLVTGVPSGFSELDEMTHGLQKGEMIILAARPSMGKTALALNVAEQMAMMNHPVAVFSLEMGKEQLVQRLLSSRSGVDMHRMRRGMLGHDEYERLQEACSQLYETPLYIDDTPGLSLLQLRAKARRLSAKHGIEAIVIDYLQLMSSGRRAESRQVEIGEISRGVKAMARELQVPVLCLSQLNRAAEQREGHRPRMSDLRESGSIEQDADVVAMLHREEYYHRGDPDWAIHNEDKVGLAELILAKQRNGPTGTVRLTWDGRTTRFRDHTDRDAPGGGGWSRPMAAAGDAPAAPRSNFVAAPATGPVSGFRDGGGPTGGDDLGGLPT